jgi:hypothetical protein
MRSTIRWREHNRRGPATASTATRPRPRRAPDGHRPCPSRPRREPPGGRAARRAGTTARPVGHAPSQLADLVGSISLGPHPVGDLHLRVPFSSHLRCTSPFVGLRSSIAAAAVRRRVPTTGRRPAGTHRRRRSDGPGSAPRGDNHIQRGRPNPARRHFGSATTRTRHTDATRASTRREDQSGIHRLLTAPTRPNRRRAAPHPTNDTDTHQRRRTIHPLETAS